MTLARAIRGVLFDLDGTIRINLPSAGEVFDSFVASQGVHLSSEDRLLAARWEHYYFANSTEIRADRALYDGREDAFWTNFGRRRLTALGLPSDGSDSLAVDVADHMRLNYQPRSHVPEGVKDLMRDLRLAGLTLGVVSNRSTSYVLELEELGLAMLVDFSLAAGEVGSWKPHPEIFLEAVRRAHIAPSAAAYVGDNYFADVVGARGSGLLPVLYDPGEVFPEADCSVIRSFDELPNILGVLNMP